MRHNLLLLVISAMIAAWPSAFAQSPSSPPTKYLALGDSLATGFNPFLFPPKSNEYVGYPEMVSNVTNQVLANAACPGETSSSLIDARNPLDGFTCGPDPTVTVYNPSGRPVRRKIDSKVPYEGARSQLEYAVHYLKTNPDVGLVTINIGGNDLAPLLTCTNPLECQVQAARVLTQFANNLVFIYTAIRSTGYTGPIVAANYYAFNYNDPQQVGPLGVFPALNTVIASVTTLFGGRVADVFTAFQAASGASGDPCQAGLLLKIPNGTGCDTHPSPMGQGLIASTVTYQVNR